MGGLAPALAHVQLPSKGPPASLRPAQPEDRTWPHFLNMVARHWVSAFGVSTQASPVSASLESPGALSTTAPGTAGIRARCCLARYHPQLRPPSVRAPHTQGRDGKASPVPPRPVCPAGGARVSQPGKERVREESEGSWRPVGDRRLSVGDKLCVAARSRWRPR